MTCEIIATGGKGNAVLVNGSLLFDCGVPYSMLKERLDDISIVFLTHIHQDHFKVRTIRKLHRARPGIRFVCSKNLITDLYCDAKVPLDNIVLIRPEDSPVTIPGTYLDETIEVCTFDLIHDVENVGYVVRLRGGQQDGSAMYATDTHHIPVMAPELDLYMIEGNYTCEDIERRAAEKAEAGMFSYESRVKETHMSIETAVEWLRVNADPLNSRIVFLHGHTDGKEAQLNG